MPTPVDVALLVHGALAAAGVEHAFGGAIAYGFVAQPRGTVDVDVNVFLSEEEAPGIIEVLCRSGCDVDPVAATRSIRERGDFRGRCLGFRVDFFTPFHPFHDSVRARMRRVELTGTPIQVISAEDLIVFKCLFDRPKDWADIDAMVRALGPAFDRAYVERWLRDILPEDDPRVEKMRNH